MIKGSCFCKNIRYTVSEPLGPISHCHCSTCQKTHAAAFATVARVKTSGFTLNTGENLLTSFKSSPSKTRYFCSQCGTHIYAFVDGQDEYILYLGIFDDDPLAKPIRHIFVEEKSPWYEIDKKLPQFDQWPT